MTKGLQELFAKFQTGQVPTTRNSLGESILGLLDALMTEYVEGNSRITSEIAQLFQNAVNTNDPLYEGATMSQRLVVSMVAKSISATRQNARENSKDSPRSENSTSGTFPPEDSEPTGTI